MHLDVAKELLKRMTKAAAEAEQTPNKGPCNCNQCRQERAIREELAAKTDLKLTALFLTGAQLAALASLLEREHKTSLLYEAVLSQLETVAAESELQPATLAFIRAGIAARRLDRELAIYKMESQSAPKANRQGDPSRSVAPEGTTPAHC